MSYNNQRLLKLSLFVMAGLFLLIFTLYLVGRSKHLFGSTFEIRARFNNADGLLNGDNVYFSGIQAGTVKSIKLINGIIVEVTMLIDEKIKTYIHKDATAFIGTEGLMGNRSVNILPGRESDLPIQDGDLLSAATAFSKDEMLLTFGKTNSNIQLISTELAVLIHRVNNSKVLWGILEDTSLSSNIKRSLNNISQASANVNHTTKSLEDIVSDVKAGKGTAGALLSDTAFENKLKEVLSKIGAVGDKATGLINEFNSMAVDIHHDLQYGQGTAHALLTDSMMVNKLNLSLDNVERGTEAFNKDMEALKHNFLLRGYFRRLERKQRDSVK
jgi:phospholipid/cholesterol/gamma-HCH transport system substrate-binding protein